MNEILTQDELERTFTKEAFVDFLKKLDLDGVKVNSATNCFIGKFFKKHWPTLRIEVGYGTPYFNNCPLKYPDWAKPYLAHLLSKRTYETETPTSVAAVWTESLAFLK